MDAALDLLAERGEDGVTLRELTDAADANVAAVSYHFGSLKSLCDAAIEHALERYLDAQEEAVSALDPDSTLEALAAAFARPMISSLVAGGRDLAVMRIVARAGIDPPQGWDRLDARFERIRARRPSGAQGQPSWRQGSRVDLPHPLRGRIDQLAGARTRGGRAEEQVPEADRATAGTDTRRSISRRQGSG